MGREHWVEVELWQVAANSKYPIGDGDHGQIKPSAYQKNGIPYIRVGDMGWGELILKNVVYISKETHQANLKSELKPHDVLIAKTGATIGKCCILPETIEVANTTSSVGKITLNHNAMLPKWLMNYFLTREFTDFMWSISQRTAQPGFNNRDIELFKVPLPPLNEQKRIVEKLDALLPKVKSAKVRLAKIPAILKKFRQSVLVAACSGGLTEEWREEYTERTEKELGEGKSLLDSILKIKRELQSKKLISKDKEYDVNVLELPMPLEIPSTWIWARMNDVFEILRGASPRPAGDPKYFGGNIPWITVKELTKDESIYLEEVEFFINEEGKKLSRDIFKGELLLTNSGATLGVPKISKIDGCINDAVALLRKHHNLINTYFTYYYLLYQKESFRQINQGMAQPNLNTSIISAWLLPLPPLEEQHEIIRRVEKLFAIADSLEAKYRKAFAQVEKLEQAILAKAFRGELVEPDPNDEPASELLKRILEEKAKLEAGKKSKKPRARKK